MDAGVDTPCKERLSVELTPGHLLDAQDEPPRSVEIQEEFALASKRVPPSALVPPFAQRNVVEVGRDPGFRDTDQKRPAVLERSRC